MPEYKLGDVVKIHQTLTSKLPQIMVCRIVGFEGIVYRFEPVDPIVLEQTRLRWRAAGYLRLNRSRIIGYGQYITGLFDEPLFEGETECHK